MLLIHGWEDDNSLWSPLIDALTERDRSLVAFDMPAHGFSDGEWGLHPQAGDAVLAVAAALGPIDAVVGHSSGAAIAALALREGLAVERAVFVAPPLRAANRWLRVADRLGYSRDVAAAAQATYEERIGRARAGFDLRTELPTLDVDLLVVHSVDDERMPVHRLGRGGTEIPPRRNARRQRLDAQKNGTRSRGCHPHGQLPDPRTRGRLITRACCERLLQTSPAVSSSGSSRAHDRSHAAISMFAPLRRTISESAPRRDGQEHHPPLLSGGRHAKCMNRSRALPGQVTGYATRAGPAWRYSAEEPSHQWNEKRTAEWLSERLVHSAP